MYSISVFTKRDLNSHMKRTAGWIVTYEVSNESHLTCLHILRYSTVKLGIAFLRIVLAHVLEQSGVAGSASNIWTMD